MINELVIGGLSDHSCTFLIAIWNMLLLGISHQGKRICFMGFKTRDMLTAFVTYYLPFTTDLLFKDSLNLLLRAM